MRREASDIGADTLSDELPLAVARKRWWRWSRAPGLLVAVSALVTLVGLLNGASFVAKVTVEGARLVPEADLVASAGIAGQSVFLVRPADIERKLLETYGCLEDVSVATRLPNMVTIKVRERSHLTVWQSGGQRWWVDASGNVLGAAMASPGLVVVEDAVGHMPMPGNYVAGVPWKMARDVAQHLGTAPHFYFQEQGLTLYVHVLEDDVPAYLGCEGDGAAKAAILQALVEHLEREGIQPAYLDLSRESSPVFKVSQG